MSSPIYTSAKKRIRPNVGHSVVNGKLRVLSVSQIVTYDKNQVGGCPRKWAFDKLFGKKEPQKSWQADGVDFASNLEHYLKTGENTLLPVLQEGKKFFPTPGPDLEVEEPLYRDLVKAVALRDAFLAGTVSSEDVSREMIAYGPLTARGIPLDGAPDYRHRRGEWIDSDGILRREASGTNVVYIGDLKTTNQIDNHKTRTGKITLGHAKTNAEVCAHPQMVGYGKHAITVYPELTHTRLHHVYCSTGKKGAAIRGGLISKSETQDRWGLLEENVVAKMEQTATATKIEDIEPNLDACHVYGGCGHMMYCPKTEDQAFQNLFSTPTNTENSKESGMSLFNQLAQHTNTEMPPPAPEPLISVADYDAQVAAAKQKLLAEEDAKTPPAPEAPRAQVSSAGKIIAVIECIAGTQYLVDCGDGHRPYAMVYIGPSKDKHFFKDTKGGKATLETGDTVQEILADKPSGTSNGVSPPDAPKDQDLFHAAAPLSQETIDAIADPELKDKAQRHREAHLAAASASAVEKPKKASGRCNDGLPLKVSLSQQQAISRKVACPQCGVAKAIPKKDIEADATTWIFPVHNRPKGEEVTVAPAPPQEAVEEEEAPPPPPPPAGYRAPGALPGQTAMTEVVRVPPAPAPGARTYTQSEMDLVIAERDALQEALKRVKAVLGAV